MVLNEAVIRRKAFEKQRSVERITEKWKLILAFSKIFPCDQSDKKRLDDIINQYIGMGETEQPIKRGRDKVMQELTRVLLANNNPTDPRWERITASARLLDRVMATRKELVGNAVVASLFARMISIRTSPSL